MCQIKQLSTEKSVFIPMAHFSLRQPKQFSQALKSTLLNTEASESQKKNMSQMKNTDFI